MHGVFDAVTSLGYDGKREGGCNPRKFMSLVEIIVLDRNWFEVQLRNF